MRPRQIAEVRMHKLAELAAKLERQPQQRIHKGRNFHSRRTSTRDNDHLRARVNEVLGGASVSSLNIQPS